MPSLLRQRSIYTTSLDYSLDRKGVLADLALCRRQGPRRSVCNLIERWTSRTADCLPERAQIVSPSLEGRAHQNDRKGTAADVEKGDRARDVVSLGVWQSPNVSMVV